MKISILVLSLLTIIYSMTAGADCLDKCFQRLAVCFSDETIKKDDCTDDFSSCRLMSCGNNEKFVLNEFCANANDHSCRTALTGCDRKATCVKKVINQCHIAMQKCIKPAPQDDPSTM